jgi:acyl carrier protein
LTRTTGPGDAVTRLAGPDATFARFQSCVAEVLDVEADAVRRDARWREDLEADSLAVAEIILALDDEFGVRIPDIDPDAVATVGAAFDLLSELVGVAAG